jgi:hypothetical protein
LLSCHFSCPFRVSVVLIAPTCGRHERI